MKFYSTNNRNHAVSLSEAVIHGLAPDKGLYMPERIPVFTNSFFSSLHEKSFQEIAFEVAKVLIEEDISNDELIKIVKHTVCFDAPLIEVGKNVFSLELFHGPTFAFKDFGARFLSRVLGYFATETRRELVNLVSTS